MVCTTPRRAVSDKGLGVGPEAIVNARIAESDRLLQEIRGQIATHVPLAAWPLLWRVALERALTPAPTGNLNPAEWRKIEAVRFWVRIDEREAFGGDPTDLACLVDRLRADLASGWDRSQPVS